jgi:hypothetical protein
MKINVSVIDEISQQKLVEEAVNESNEYESDK